MTAPRAGEEATPDSYGIMRTDLLQIIKQAEALNPGMELEELGGRDFAAIGAELREFDISYMQRYGLTTKDFLQMKFGGPRGAKTAELAGRIKATQEAFFEPRAVPTTPVTVQSQQPAQEELPQSL